MKVFCLYDHDILKISIDDMWHDALQRMVGILMVTLANVA